MSNFVTLLVEDDTFQREALADVLKDEGFEVIECTTGEAAELIVASTGTELQALVTDHNLPGAMSGTALARYARSRSPTSTLSSCQARSWTSCPSVQRSCRNPSPLRDSSKRFVPECIWFGLIFLDRHPLGWLVAWWPRREARTAPDGCRQGRVCFPGVAIGEHKPRSPEYTPIARSSSFFDICFCESQMCFRSGRPPAGARSRCPCPICNKANPPDTAEVPAMPPGFLI